MVDGGEEMALKGDLGQIICESHRVQGFCSVEGDGGRIAWKQLVGGWK